MPISSAETVEEGNRRSGPLSIAPDRPSLRSRVGLYPPFSLAQACERLASLSEFRVLEATVSSGRRIRCSGSTRRNDDDEPSDSPARTG